MPEIIGENVDRLCTVEMRPQGMPRGKIHRLYEAARRKQNGRPLTLLAAEKLRAAVKPGDYVILATGAGVPPWMPAGETDGPVGLSTRHTLAIVAHEGARARDIVAFARRVRARVEARFGVRLVPEPIFWGFPGPDDGLPKDAPR